MYEEMKKIDEEEKKAVRNQASTALQWGAIQC